MKTYEFSIIASGLEPTAEDFEARFFDAGCDDATISFQKGHIIADFAREADSVGEAIASAIQCMKAAGAKVERVEPDPLVNLSDIASRTGLTRAAVSQYSRGERSQGFPAPVVRVTTESPLWDWSAVAKWLVEHDKLTRDEAIEAAVVKAANMLLKTGRCPDRNALKRSLKDYEDSLGHAA